MDVLLGFGAGGIAGTVVLTVAVILWILGHRDSDDATGDSDDPDAPDEDGFIPADKYGYGYGYSWGDPYGDPDM